MTALVPENGKRRSEAAAEYGYLHSLFLSCLAPAPKNGTGANFIHI